MPLYLPYTSLKLTERENKLKDFYCIPLIKSLHDVREAETLRDKIQFEYNVYCWPVLKTLSSFLILLFISFIYRRYRKWTRDRHIRHIRVCGTRRSWSRGSTVVSHCRSSSLISRYVSHPTYQQAAITVLSLKLLILHSTSLNV